MYCGCFPKSRLSGIKKNGERQAAGHAT
jgi:hypothetical protein